MRQNCGKEIETEKFHVLISWCYKQIPIGTNRFKSRYLECFGYSKRNTFSW